MDPYEDPRPETISVACTISDTKEAQVASIQVAGLPTTVIPVMVEWWKQVEKALFPEVTR